MEAMLGRIVKTRRDVIVVTKGGTDRTTEPPRKRFDAEFIKESVGRSLKRLGRDRIDLYMLHNPSLDALVAGDCTKTMQELVKKGDVAHWGVSAGSDEIARTAIDKDAEVIELAYNLILASDLHRLAGEIMVQGAGVLARSTLAYGLLAGTWTAGKEFPDGDHRADRWTRPEIDRRIEQLSALRFLVHGDVPTLRSAAVRFVLSNNLVSAAVLGPRNVEQLEDIVREVGMGPIYLSDDHLMRIPRVLQAVGIDP